MLKKLRVLVLCGGPSTEHEVSLKTAKIVLGNLDRTKYIPEICVIDKEGSWKIGNQPAIDITEALKKVKKFDFVFIAMHGAFGEDGRIQAFLEWIGMPYSGSGVASSAMAMDKNVSNILYAAHGLRVPKYIIVDENTTKQAIRFPPPFVIKPIDGGSSVGVSIVKNKNEFEIYGRAMIQEYKAGREFTCAVIEDAKGNPFALPPTEIIPRGATFFDYHAKYEVGGSTEITPPQLPIKRIKELQKLALDAHQILGCSGISRSDFILSKGKFYILETNTIPGMTETSLLPQAAAVAGIDFRTLLDMIIAAGLRKI
jgi:D-alanine-D-alanine ligase